ncbi:MAG: glycosyl transferase [Planctomycetota bacterium]|nr:MAG: glycosyl transferase [Planctomycetota bacterium]
MSGRPKGSIAALVTHVPQISIGLPVFNGEAYLEATLESLLGQSFGDFEVVICDNASTDASAEILERFAARDSRIRIHGSEENRGAAWNYNRAVALARAPYFKWASHDDLLAPEYLACCLQALEQSPDAVLAYPRTRRIGPAGEWLDDYDDRLTLGHERASQRLRHLLHHMRLCNPVFGLIRRELLLQTGLIGAYVSSDEVLLVELALRGLFVEVPRRLFLRRVHPGSCFGGGKTLEEVALWFDPHAELESFLPRTQKLVHLMLAIEKGPLSELERLRCYAVLLHRWPAQNWRVIAGEWRRLLLSKMRSIRLPDPQLLSL